MHLLAFDTSTEHLSIAVQAGGRVLGHDGAGGAQASHTLIPAIEALLAQAGTALDRLDAIVFGQGPGSFTGLRTACAVAQGLAFGARAGAGVPVLPVPTLMAVAEDARQTSGCTQVLAALDARMGEVYAARFAWEDGPHAWRMDGPMQLLAPEAVAVPPGWTLAGNAVPAYGERLAPAAARVAALAHDITEFLVALDLQGDADDFALATKALAAIRDAIGLLETFSFSCRKATPANPFLRELLIPFGTTGYVALFEIEDAHTVTVLAVRHQREDDYH